MEDGIYKGIPEQDYFDLPRFSKSMVGPLLKSGRHLQEYLRNGIGGSGVRMGSLVDCLVLSPEEFDIRYALTPPTYTDSKGEEKLWNYQSKSCREFRDELESRGVTVITPEDYHKAQQIKKSLEESKTASGLLDGDTQVSLLWTDPETGVPCKGRIDVLGESIVDLKTSSGLVDVNSFRQSLYKFKYHVQAFAYQEGYSILTGEQKGFDFVAVETADPFGVGCYSIREDSLMLGEMEWRKALRKYAQILDTGIYEGYPDVLELIDVPAWALKPIYEGEEEGLIL